VQVEGRPGHLDLEISQPAQGIDNAGRVRPKDVRVRNQRHIRSQQIAMALDERVQARATDLLLALHNELEVDGRGAFRGVEGLCRLHMDEKLALVIRSAPGVDICPADRRLEWRREPLIHGIGRLHVIVAVDKHRGGVGPSGKPFGVDHGVPPRGHHLGARETRSSKAVSKPAGGSFDVGPVYRLCADAGNAQKCLELIKETWPVLVSEAKWIDHGYPC